MKTLLKIGGDFGAQVNTKTHKEALKEAGFKWASKKKAWYFRPEEFRSRSRGKASLDEIRTKYGSTQPQRKNYQLQGRNE